MCACIWMPRPRKTSAVHSSRTVLNCVRALQQLLLLVRGAQGRRQHLLRLHLLLRPLILRWQRRLILRWSPLLLLLRLLVLPRPRRLTTAMQLCPNLMLLWRLEL